MTRSINPADLWNMARVAPPEPLPDGGAAVVAVTTFDDDHQSGHGRLWIVHRDGTSTPLTGESRSASAPVVSPDGATVAFLAKPAGSDDPGQLHLIRIGGGEAEAGATLPLGTRAVQWLPDGSGLVAAAPLYRDHPTIEGTEHERDARNDAKPKPVATEDRMYRFWKRWLAGDTIDHLFRIDLDGSPPVHLTPWLDRLIALDSPAGSFDVAPDGATVAVTIESSLPPWDRALFAVFLVPTSGGDPMRLSDRPGQQRSPKFSDDGTSVVYGWQEDPDFYADRVRLVRHDLASGREEVLLDWDRSPTDWRAAGPDRIVFSAEDAGRLRVYELVAGGTPRPLTSVGSCHGARPSPLGVWHVTEATTRPPEIAVTAEHTEIVSHFNDALVAELDLGDYEEIEVAAGDDAPVQVQITYPPGFDPARRWPLLQNVHGGPHNASLDQWHWRWNTQVFAAAGFVVASVNFHGSSSWGQDFTTSIRGAWGDLPTADVLAATDHLVGLGFVDTDRMAIAGGSYGGYLTSWITSRTDRFRCAVVHAGVTDLVGQWASDITAGREQAVGGVPWEDLAAVEAWSPTANMSAVVTPTLVVHGELDYRVVITQGLLWYGLLKAKGVPARLVYFRDEGHWIERRDNAVAWWGEVLGWLDRWLAPSSG